ncbi:unnamed protein product [Parajaminaea phylloscopi]
MAHAESSTTGEGNSVRLPRRAHVSPVSQSQTSEVSRQSPAAANIAGPAETSPYPGADYSGVESSATKNVVVLGGSYGGMHAATVLAQKLPPSHRVILIERNSHFNHLYVFPRFSVMKGHEHKAFIPYTSIFGSAPKRRSDGTPSGISRTPRPVEKISRRTGAGEGSNSHSAVLEMGGAGSSGEPGAAHEDPRASTPARLLASRLLRRSGASDASDDERSPSTSSNTRSTDSREDDSLFDRKSAHSNGTADTESWTSNDRKVTSDAAGEPQAVTPDAGNKKMEHALLQDGQTRAKVEEELGRPGIQVKELGEAIREDFDLVGEADTEADIPADETTATGFEDAAPHVVLQATVTGITDSHVIVAPTRQQSSPGGNATFSRKKLWSIDSLSIPYTHLVYALGSHLPDPLRTMARSKPEGISWMRHTQEQIKDAHRIVLVGGGALGVEFATDIKSVYPDKDVTLIHSRQRLLPNFDERVHDYAKARLEELGVNLVLGERLALTEGCPRGSTTALSPGDASEDTSRDAAAARPIRRPSDALHAGLKRVRTTGGKEFVCDLLMLCTGQQPNSSLMASLSPTSVDPHTRLVRIHPTLQVALPPPDEATPGPFDARPPCGDCDCFLDKKAAGADLDSRQQGHLDEHGHGEETPSRSGRLPNVYAIGDVADAFGSLNAGYQAWGMADVAAENIIRDIGFSTDLSGGGDADSPSHSHVKAAEPELMRFDPAPNMLKLSLGTGKMIFQGGPIEHRQVGADGEEETVMRPEISVKDDPEDLGVEGVWTFMANAPIDDMYR